LYRVLYTGYSRQVGNRTFYFRRRRSRLRPSRHPSILHGDSDLLLRALGRRLRGSCGSGSSHARTHAASAPRCLAVAETRGPARNRCEDAVALRLPPAVEQGPDLQNILRQSHWRSQGGGEHAPPTEIGFTKKFLAAPLS